MASKAKGLNSSSIVPNDHNLLRCGRTEKILWARLKPLLSLSPRMTRIWPRQEMCINSSMLTFSYLSSISRGNAGRTRMIRRGLVHFWSSDSNFPRLHLPDRCNVVIMLV